MIIFYDIDKDNHYEIEWYLYYH